MNADRTRNTDEEEWDEQFGAWVVNPKEQVEQHEGTEMEEE
jgi:hypothetical protein